MFLITGTSTFTSVPFSFSDLTEIFFALSVCVIRKSGFDVTAAFLQGYRRGRLRRLVERVGDIESAL